MATRFGSKNSRHMNARGYSIIELLVALAVVGLVSTAIYTLFISQRKAAEDTAAISEAQRNARVALDLITNELYLAGFKAQNDVLRTTTATTLEFIADVVDNAGLPLQYGGANTATDTIVYAYNAADDLVTRDANSAGAKVISDLLTDVTFTYYDVDGDQVAYTGIDGVYPAEQTTRDTIRRIDISVTAVTARPAPGDHSGDDAYYYDGSDYYYKRTLRNQIQLRNLFQVTGGAGCGLLQIGADPSPIQACYPPGETSTITLVATNPAGNPVANAEIFLTSKPGGVTFSDSSPLTDSSGQASVTMTSPATDSGAIVTVVGKWTPSGCDYDLITTKIVNIVAGDPDKFLAVPTATPSSATVYCPAGSCLNEPVISATVSDACDNPLSGETVTFTADMGIFPITGNSGPASATDVGDGTYTVIYQPPSTVGTATITAEDLNLPVARQTKVMSLPVSECGRANLSVLPSSITLNQCPSNSQVITATVTDACGNTIDGLTTLTASIDDSSLGSVTTPLTGIGSGQYQTTFTTPASCGAGGSTTIRITDSGGVLTEQTVGVTLNQCPLPSVQVTVTPPTDFSGVPGGCGSPAATVEAQVLSNSCVPVITDPDNPVSVAFTVTSTGSGNGVFSENGFSTVTVNTTTGIATVNLESGTAAAGDVLTVVAQATVPQYGGAVYTSVPDSNDSINVIVSDGAIKTFSDSGYTTEASAFGLSCSTGGVSFLQVDDCNVNQNPGSVETLTVTAVSAKTGDSETVTLTETGDNTALFQSPLSTDVNLGGAVNDGTLQVTSGDRVTISYVDPTDGTDTETRVVTINGLNDDMESGINGWTATGFWHQTTTNPLSLGSPTSWWYGQDSTGDFDNGVINSGNLISPSFTIDTVSELQLTFQSFDDIESANPASFDLRNVYITKGGGSWIQIFRSTDNTFTWHRVSDSLSELDSSWDNQPAQLRFEFDTVTAADNTFRGWQVDEVLVGCVGDVTPPADPSGLIGTTVSNNIVDLEWTTGSESDLVSYTLLVYQDDPGYKKPVDVVTGIVPGALTTLYTYTRSGTDPFVTSIFDFCIRAVDTSNNISTTPGVCYTETK